MPSIAEQDYARAPASGNSKMGALMVTGDVAAAEEGFDRAEREFPAAKYPMPVLHVGRGKQEMAIGAEYALDFTEDRQR